jgi:cytochrome P450
MSQADQATRTSPADALALRHGSLQRELGDPYPFYAQLRSRGLHLGDMGVWIAARHRDVQAAFQHECVGNKPHPQGKQASVLSRRLATDAPFELLARRLFELGGDRHGQTRAVLGERVRGPRLREQLADLRVFTAEVVAHRHGPVDLIGNVAFPIAARLILRLLGVSDEVHAGYLAVLRRLAEALGPNQDPDRMVVADQRVREGLAILAGDGSASLTPDPLDTLALGVLVYMAALEPGAYLVGNAALAMMEVPALAEELGGGTASAALVDEVLRYCAPLQMVGKTVLRDARINGVDIPQGSQMALIIGAANRDPDVFADPDRFDAGRSPNPHLTLADGYRSCVGGPLVRGMLKVVLPLLATALRGVPSGTEISWRQSYQLRGLQELYVLLGKESV